MSEEEGGSVVLPAVQGSQAVDSRPGGSRRKFRFTVMDAHSSAFPSVYAPLLLEGHHNSNTRHTYRMANGEGRAFVRVFLPNDQLRLFQLLPRVKFSSVLRALGSDGSLYIGERKIEGNESPESLGLKNGLDNAIDVSFVPRPPQFLFHNASSRGDRDEATSGTYTPSLVFEEQTQRFPRDEALSCGSEASQPLSRDVQAVLRLMKDKHDQAKSPPAACSDSGFPHINHSQINLSTPTPSVYNPRSNELRQAAVVQRSPSPPKHQPVSRANAVLVDRPPRRALPLEHHQRDTTVPHTTWQTLSDSGHNDSHVSFHSATVKEPPSPKLQGTRPRDKRESIERTELDTVGAPAEAEPNHRTAPAQSQSNTQPPTDFESAPTTARDSAACSMPLQPVAVCTDAAPSLEFQHVVQKLAVELEEEKRLRKNLERQVEWLTSLLPEDLVSYTAQQEHHRLMEELRQERLARRRHTNNDGGPQVAARSSDH